MASFVKNGHRRLYSNTGSAISAGGVVVTRSGTSGEIGIALVDIAATTGTGELAMSGVHSMAKASGAISAGATVYWDTTPGDITTTASGNTLAGVADEAATTAATTINVLINGRPGPN